MGRNILITGGAGFIGTNLTRHLEELGDRVWILDNLSRGRKEYIKNPDQLIEKDIRYGEDLTESFKGMDAVIHLAAFGSVVESVSQPSPNFDINVRGTFNVLEAARESGVKRMIFASTGGALIGEASPPVDENSLPRPISPYGSSKLCGEAYCHAFAKAYGLGTVCLRFANVYGPFSAHKKGAATKFMKCILNDEPMPIFGDGSSTRDFLHVDDLCAGIILGLDKEIAPGEVFHLASGRDISILNLARTIADIAGSPEHDILFFPARPGEVRHNFARYDKANKELGFKPLTDMRQGLKETWDWYLKNKEHVLSIEESDS